MRDFSPGSPDGYPSRHQCGKRPEDRCSMQEESAGRMEGGTPSVGFRGDTRDSQSNSEILCSMIDFLFMSLSAQTALPYKIDQSGHAGD